MKIEVRAIARLFAVVPTDICTDSREDGIFACNHLIVHHLSDSFSEAAFVSHDS